jgi:hypothetical protein
MLNANTQLTMQGGMATDWMNALRRNEWVSPAPAAQANSEQAFHDQQMNYSLLVAHA